VHRNITQQTFEGPCMPANPALAMRASSRAPPPRSGAHPGVSQPARLRASRLTHYVYDASQGICRAAVRLEAAPPRQPPPRQETSAGPLLAAARRVAPRHAAPARVHHREGAGKGGRRPSSAHSGEDPAAGASSSSSSSGSSSSSSSSSRPDGPHSPGLQPHGKQACGDPPDTGAQAAWHASAAWHGSA
jgi:hypothetical protein